MAAWSGTNQVIPPAAIPQAAPPASASAAVFGPGYSGATGGGGGAFSGIPSLDNPGGVAFWTGVAGFAFLIVLYHSLPGGKVGVPL